MYFTQNTKKVFLFKTYIPIRIFTMTQTFTNTLTEMLFSLHFETCAAIYCRETQRKMEQDQLSKTNYVCKSQAHQLFTLFHSTLN